MHTAGPTPSEIDTKLISTESIYKLQFWMYTLGDEGSKAKALEDLATAVSNKGSDSGLFITTMNNTNHGEDKASFTLWSWDRLVEH